VVSDKDVLRELLKKRDILSTKALVKWLFPRNAAAQNMTYYQAYIVKRIAFSEAKRLNISAFTRYGKTQFVAIGVAIYILLNKNKKVVFIGPTDEQAGIIKNYMAELILDCPLLLGIADIELRSKAERIRAEASQRRMTFSNGCEYRVVTAHGKGFSAMGHGADLCFPKGTLIMTNKGLIDIEELVFKKLDYDVLSFNHESNKFEFKKINYWFDNGDSDLVKVVHSKGFFRCSLNHPVFTDRGYVSAKDLCVNDKIYILNDFGKCYGSKLRSMWKKILYKTKSFQKKKKTLLFKDLFWFISERRKESSMEGRKRRESLCSLWKKICSELSRIKKKNILLGGVQRKSVKTKTEKENENKLFVLSERSNCYSCKKRKSKVLFNKLFKQVSFKKNDGRRKSCLERWDSVRRLWKRVQYSFKKKNKVKRWFEVFFVRFKEYFTSASYRLCKDKQCGFKSCYSLCELSFKDKFQQGLLEEVVVRKVEFLKNKERVYNLEVDDNNNYFADGVLVHNCIMDEAALVSRESYAKIMRMLGDDAENAVFVELFNPWDRDTKAYDHSISPRFERIQISYEVGLKEGRITEDFVEEMRGDMTPLEFTVLYESRFPDESEDSLHSLKHISRAEELCFGFLDEVNKILGKLEKKKELSESEFNFLVSELKRYDFRVSCDPADKGLDFTVMFWGIVKDKQFYEILGVWSEAKSESMSVVGKIVKKVQEFVPKGAFGSVYVDKIGIGTGTESRLREIKNELGLEHIRVVGCHYGEGAVRGNEFQNKKAENHFRCRDLFVEGRVSLKALVKDKDYVRVKSELLSMKWEITSTAKKKIVDPDKSPDFNDGVVYFVWLDRKELVADFI
jgi:hypothetical protein